MGRLLSIAAYQQFYFLRKHLSSYTQEKALFSEWAKRLSGCWLYVIGTTLFTPTPHVYTQTLAYDVIHRTSQAKNKEGNTERG